MKKQSWLKRDPIKNYFPIPNEIYSLGLSLPELPARLGAGFAGRKKKQDKLRGHKRPPEEILLPVVRAVAGILRGSEMGSKAERSSCLCGRIPRNPGATTKKQGSHPGKELILIKADSFRFSEEELRRRRAESVGNVKRTNGRLSFEKRAREAWEEGDEWLD